MSERQSINPFELKVKFLSLAAEARIIKQEEAKALRIARKLAKSKRPEAKGWMEAKLAQRESLRYHRRVDVAEEARSTNVARAFLRGRSYIEVEARRWCEPSWPRVRDLVKKFTNNSNQYLSELEEWILIGDNAVHQLTSEERREVNAARKTAYHNRPKRTREQFLTLVGAGADM